MSNTPLGRAREALLDAKAASERNPSGANLRALEDARAHVDYLLDTLPRMAPLDTPSSSTPDGPGAQPPGPSVSLAQEVLALQHEESECLPGESDSEGER